VLGIDVGYSPSARTTCFCLLRWDASSTRFTFRVTGSGYGERSRAISELVPERKLAGVALDGPLTRGLALVRHYRAAEAVLSRGILQKRGKPGQTSAPVGQRLHEHATRLANQALRSLEVASATHWQAIHEKRVVEAFPNMFLGSLIDEDALPALRRDASDRYWEVAVERTGKLTALLTSLLPGRRLTNDLRSLADHEERAGVICAMTALATATDAHVAVGDAIDGDIILPPASAWGSSSAGEESWFESVLRKNVPLVRASRDAHSNHRGARVATATGLWFS
jgi:hypothetical protein